jgi:hypothetical protein
MRWSFGKLGVGDDAAHSLSCGELTVVAGCHDDDRSSLEGAQLWLLWSETEVDLASAFPAASRPGEGAVEGAVVAELTPIRGDMVSARFCGVLGVCITVAVRTAARCASGEGVPGAEP